MLESKSTSEELADEDEIKMRWVTDSSDSSEWLTATYIEQLVYTSHCSVMNMKIEGKLKSKKMQFSLYYTVN